MDPQLGVRMLFRTRAQFALMSASDPTLESGTVVQLLDEETLAVLRPGAVRAWVEYRASNAPLDAVTIYVAPTTGNDANDGSTPALAVRDLPRALALRPTNAPNVLLDVIEAGTLHPPDSTDGPYFINVAGGSKQGNNRLWIRCPDLEPVTAPLALTAPSADGVFFTVAGWTLAAGEARGMFLRLEDGSDAHLEIVENDGAGNVETLGGFGPVGGAVEVTVVDAVVTLVGDLILQGPGGNGVNLVLQCCKRIGADQFQSMDVLLDRSSAFNQALACFPGFEDGRIDAGTVDPLAPPTSQAPTWIADPLAGDGGSVNILRGATMTSGLLAFYQAVTVFDRALLGGGPQVLRRSPIAVLQNSQWIANAGSADAGIVGIRNGDAYAVEGGTLTAGADFFEAIFVSLANVFGSQKFRVDDNDLVGMTLIERSFCEDGFHGANHSGPGRQIGGGSIAIYYDLGNGTLLGDTPGVNDVLLGLNVITFAGGTNHSYAAIAAAAEQSINDRQGNSVTQGAP